MAILISVAILSIIIIYAITNLLRYESRANPEVTPIGWTAFRPIYVRSFACEGMVF
jgi:hypothetical protein